MTEHADQGIEHWAQQGIVQSVERESPESDVVEQVMSAPPTGPAPVPADPARPTAHQQPVVDVDQPAPAAHPTLDGQPGTTSTPGDQAEHAAFLGDGAYSEGRAAGQNYHSGGVQD